MIPDFYRTPIVLDNIQIGTRLRHADQEKVAEIASSIAKVGLLSPIIVRFIDDVPNLVAGLHRLLALKSLGEETADCNVYGTDPIHAELMEIAENLHRADLNLLQRSEQVARWIELTAGEQQIAEPEPAKQRDDEQRSEVLRQVDAKQSGGRPKGGVRAAARDLGISEPDARRAIKVASLSPSAKTAAKAFCLDKNQSALLKAAKEIEPEKQVAVLRELHEAKQHKADRKAVDKITRDDMKEVADKGAQVSAAIITLPAIAAAKAGDGGLKRKLAAAQTQIDVLMEENANLRFIIGELMEEVETIYQDTIDWRVHAQRLHRRFPIFAKIGADAERRLDAAYPTDDDGNDVETDYVEPGRDELIDALLAAYNTGQLSGKNQNTEQATQAA
jgi:ParB family chromosome partitioning protein